eukprot:3151022-Alexandrium_andersonii.AAC.1
MSRVTGPLWAFILTPAQDKPDAGTTWSNVPSGTNGATTGSLWTANLPEPRTDTYRTSRLSHQ